MCDDSLAKAWQPLTLSPSPLTRLAFRLFCLLPSYSSAQDLLFAGPPKYDDACMH